MSNSLTCHAISIICGEEIRYFELSEVIYVNRMKKLYVCVGLHSLIFVKRDLRKVITRGSILYADIEGIYEDINKNTQLIIFFDNKNNNWIDNKISFACLNRYILCNFLEVAWTTDYIFRTGKYFNLPRYEIDLGALDSDRRVNKKKKKYIKLKVKERFMLLWDSNRGGINNSRRRSKRVVGKIDEETRTELEKLVSKNKSIVSSIPQYPEIKEFNGYRRYEYEGYFFFARKGFENKATQIYYSHTGSYVSFNGVEITIYIYPSLSLHNKKPGITNLRNNKAANKSLPNATSTVGSLQNVALEYIRFLLSSSIDRRYIVYKNNYYSKKMNLSDDISTWIGWEIYLKTSKKAIACILLRRSYIPPTLDSYQDIAVIYSCYYNDMKKYNITDRDLLRECRQSADTFSPISQHHTWYLEIVQSQLDTLLYDESSYLWIGSHMKLYPIFRESAKHFLKSILLMLKNANTLVDMELLDDINHLDRSGSSKYDLNSYDIDESKGLLETFEDPLKFINETLVNLPGIDVFSKDESERRKLHLFEVRFARYLSFCIDGGLLGTRFVLEDLVAAVGLAEPKIDIKLRQVLDYLLHVRSKNIDEPYKQISLVKLLEDPSFVRNYYFIPSVMARFVSSGYCARLVPAGNEILYVEFLANLLVLPMESSFGSKSQLRIVILQQILHATKSPSKHDYYICAIPLIVEILIGDVKVNDNIAARYAAACLLNLCFSNDNIKEKMMTCGISYAIIQRLSVRDDDQLTILCLSLAINLTKIPSHRRTFISDGILTIIADIFHEEAMYINSQNLLTNILSSSITGEETQDFSPKNEQLNLLSVLLGLIGQLLNEDDVRKLFITKWCIMDYMLFLFHELEINIQSNPEIICKLLFCLKQLCISNWAAQFRVGRHCITSLINILSTHIKRPKQLDYSEQVYLYYYSYWIPNNSIGNSSFQKSLNAQNKVVNNQPNNIGDVIYNTLLLLEILTSYHPNCYEMIHNGIEDAIEICSNNYSVDTITTKLNLLKKVINEISYNTN
ncbi:hypothetical protein cand_003690 [Cryptosporidium andersoni]|uniref:Uncharacterized protein n=1 Tax=Cryptosporidium andersoni TaxID=117008 RepID=A0A1J4MM13_9CRYT|nr:hypothetical protein cand_003690 [Cryptosporidium andersoni]